MKQVERLSSGLLCHCWCLVLLWYYFFSKNYSVQPVLIVALGGQLWEIPLLHFHSRLSSFSYCVVVIPGAIHWSMVNLPKTTPLKIADSQLWRAPQLRTWSPLPLPQPCWPIPGLLLCRQAQLLVYECNGPVMFRKQFDPIPPGLQLWHLSTPLQQYT